MTSQQYSTAKKNIEHYENLRDLREKVALAISQIISEDPDRPHKQGPFTGNYRESRNVDTMKISFTQTKGGAPVTEIFLALNDCGVSACALGGFLVDKLSEQLQKIDQAIAEITA